MVPKRKRTQHPVPESGEDYDEDSDSSYNETSRLDATKKSRKTRQPAHGTRKKNHDDDSPTVANSISSHAVSIHVITAVEPMRVALLEWYDSVHDARKMPWRKKFDPSLDVEGRAQRAYEVWVSEIMLQQTQVVTVIPYYNKWMAKFPTIKDLAASDIETVNSLWKGLGYYSRAARLLSGAQKTVNELQGRLPDNAKDMQAKIPGVGRYSAGAICSIAYNHCVPVLDGNVHRLLSRFTALHALPKSKQTLDILWTGAESFIEQSKRPGDINQALIELGSTVCTVRDPVCSHCPLRLWCKAYERTQPKPDIEELCLVCEPIPSDEDDGSVTIYPMKAERKKVREELDSVNVIEWRSKNGGDRWFLLVRRPEGGLLAGLHEFPTASNLSSGKASESNVAQIPYTLLKELLMHPPHPSHSESQRLAKPTNVEPSYQVPKIAHVKPAGDVVHVFSHIKKTYRVQWVLLESEGDEPPRFRSTVSPDQIARKNGNRARKSKGKQRRLEEGSEVSEVEVNATPKTSGAQWVPLAQVEGVNISTGVLKVWKLVKKLWIITQ
ncbi:DNA glycosylase [Rhizopogon vinicolor AM-OR11-026]|uniref:Adenine DNA glycosylase n=1 Tax=Rhizopogon vinicolor AM-OR11-026 TaxID=1314800 RepID=A0A1B7NFY9_9AGAM|nr:DNA glycosylase [Rhizopogon vinicolor AM-OR11-026]